MVTVAWLGDQPLQLGAGQVTALGVVVFLFLFTLGYLAGRL